MQTASPDFAKLKFGFLYFGPMQMAYSRLDSAGRATLAAELESLWVEHNTATDGTTAVEGAYLEVRARNVRAIRA